MSNENTPTTPAGPDIKELLAELAVPFSPDQVLWRVTNTSNDKRRGQVVAYADPRAYSDRLNALVSPQGWTRDYCVQTMNNITRIKNGETIVTGKVLVTCTVTIVGLGAHSGTGEEWADDCNGMTSADAQAFKRACACFGLGRYFYDFHAPWVDLDQHRQPAKTPALPAWAIPENWRKGMRPPGKNGNGKTPASSNGNGNGHAPVLQNNPSNGNGANGRTNGSGSGNVVPGNGRGSDRKPNGGGDGANGDDLDARILRMEKAVGTGFYRNILRKYGRVNQPRLIRDLAVKRKVLQVLESATRGFNRLDAVAKRLDPNTIETLLTKLQAPPIDNIADMKTLQHVVFGLEELAGARRSV